MESPAVVGRIPYLGILYSLSCECNKQLMDPGIINTLRTVSRHRLNDDAVKKAKLLCGLVTSASLRPLT